MLSKKADDSIILVRGLCFTIGPGLVAYGMGYGWIVITGTVIFAASIPGMMRRIFGE